MIKTFLPIHLIPRGSSVALYGAGKIGRLYCEENKEIEWCRIVCAFDKKWNEIDGFPVEVYDPEQLLDYSFDFILIARMSLAGRLETDAICDYLIEKGIKREQVLLDPSCCLWSNHEAENVIYDAFDSDANTDLKVAFLPSGAMGDNIISLKLYTELSKLMKEGIIDVYSKGEYSESVFYSQPLLGRIFHSIPEREDDKWKQYDLVIRSEFEPVIQFVRLSRIMRNAPELGEKLKELIEYQSLNYSEMPVGVYTSGIRLNRARFWGLNRYTLLGCNGIFDIKDQYVNVYLNDDYLNAYDDLGLGDCYITFCFGAGGSPDGKTQQTKVWPKEKYETWVRMMKANHPDIRLIQLGAVGSEQVYGADRYLFGLSLEVVKYVLKDALLHLDCDSGLSHLATQLGTKCIVLFGPTPAWFLGYDRNENISSVKCGECKDLISDWYFRCLNYEEPECMKSISVSTVYNKTNDYLDNAKV